MGRVKSVKVCGGLGEVGLDCVWLGYVGLG
jgi:hypothetical protein